MAATEERKRLVEQIGMLVQGSKMGDVLPALADSLVRGVSLAVETPEEAEDLLRDLLPGMVASMKMNWRVMKEMQAAGLPTPAGNA